MRLCYFGDPFLSPLVLSGSAHLNISGLFLAPLGTGMSLQDFFVNQKKAIFKSRHLRVKSS